jgi:hypothetical protein
MYVGLKGSSKREDHMESLTKLQQKKHIRSAVSFFSEVWKGETLRILIN